MHFGWTPDPAGVEAWINDPLNEHPLFGCGAPNVMAEELPADPVVLYESLFKLMPGWVRSYQGTGDCVSWSWELACTLLMANRICLEGRFEEFIAPVATEAIYGGSRVEARGISRGGYSAGSYGAAAAKWLMNWGALLRIDYSKLTGNPDHDLRKYSAARADDWGNFGNGGANDKDKLDGVAKVHPVRTTSLVTNFTEAAKAIAIAKKPVPVCSNTGFVRLQRDADGFQKPAGSWAHCMLFAGYRGGARPGLLCVNSHPPRVTGGRFPANMPDAMAGVSWWVDADVCDNMLGKWQDSFAVSDLEGWKPEKLPNLGTPSEIFG